MSESEIACCCEDRAKWFGKMPRPSLPTWDDAFLDACQAAGSIVDCHPEDSSSAGAWVRVIGWVLVAACVVGAAWLLYLR